jgi:signal transduction histidine kinase
MSDYKQTRDAAEAYQAQLAAEAKLKKAIDALEKVQAFVRDLEPHADQGHTLVPALREACETLKEIKGATDE